MMSNSNFRSLLVLLCLGLSTVLSAQTTVTLGNPDFDNDQFGGINGPYSFENTSSRTQLLILAQELQDLGLGEGIISSFSFNVFNAGGGTLANMNVSIGNLNGNFGGQFEDGLTTVIDPTDFTPVDGWNEHSFDTPFLWDGTSDLVIETCYTNDGPGDNPHTVWFSFVATGGGNNWYKESDTMGNGTACDDNGSEDQLFARPQLMLTWSAPEIAPVAAIDVTSSSPCSGLITLDDNSEFEPTSWLWYFGDGLTSTLESPSHIYDTDGSYTVSLVVSNEFGTDSTSVENAINVSLATNPPVSPACVPTTQNLEAGFGITNVDLNGVSYASNDGTNGYEDLTCNTFIVDQGTLNTMELTLSGPAANHVVAWIDNNADGDFTDDEKIFSEVASDLLTVEFIVSPEALTDSTLRIRLIADFFQLGESSSCSNPSGGQAEDYAIRITPNVEVPIAAFSFSPSFSCDGEVQFEDLSENVPTSWLWQFGDSETSNEQSPVHTYDASGTYTVTLIAQNSFGQDDTIAVDIIEINLDQALTASCEPATQSYCCGYGLVGFSFGDIDNVSADASVGYEDFSCEQETELTVGMSYPISLNTGTENQHDIKVYLDYNNDGAWTPDELIYTSLNAFTHSGTVTIDPDAVILESRLRLRATVDFVGNSNTGCSSPQFGQVEDYSVVLFPDTTPPTAGFTTSEILSCDGEVSFTNTSSSTDTYLWYFGDNTTSIEENPTHTYISNGNYTVSLVATNDFGTDSLAIEDYVTVNFDAVCDTMMLPTTGVGDLLTGCFGYLTDDGGPNGDYSNSSNGRVTITVDDGNYIRLDFTEFAYQFNNDFLYIYDGADDTAPLIGTYTGTQLPNGGTITGATNSITIVHFSNFFASNEGFVLSWSCEPVGLEELNSELFSIWPNPAQEDLNISYPNELILEQVDIIDISGRTVRNHTQSSTLDLSGIHAGNYLVRLRTQRGVAYKRLSIR